MANNTENWVADLEARLALGVLPNDIDEVRALVRLARKGMVEMLWAHRIVSSIAEIDRQMSAEERVPDGSDYNVVVKIVLDDENGDPR